MFKKAQRKKVKLKIAVTGPSGSGKTYSALTLAKGLGGSTAFIDTENGSASLYSDRFDFDVVELNPPYTTAKYIEAIGAAVEAGYTNLVVDSLTHAWAGDGGILSRKEDFDAQKGGNTYANWRGFTKEHNAFLGSILHADINLIATMRSKQAVEMVEDSRGKMKPQKMGLAPIQREGMEYEFTTVFDIQMSHKAESSKDRTGLFVDQIFQITVDTGEKLNEWCSSGKTADEINGSEKENYIKNINALRAKITDETKKKQIDDFISKCTSIAQLKGAESRLEQLVNGGI